MYTFCWLTLRLGLALISAYYAALVIAISKVIIASVPENLPRLCVRALEVSQMRLSRESRQTQRTKLVAPHRNFSRRGN